MTAARQYDNHLSVEIWCDLYWRLDGMSHEQSITDLWKGDQWVSPHKGPLILTHFPYHDAVNMMWLHSMLNHKALQLYVIYIQVYFIICSMMLTIFALQWHHNGHDSVSNHQPHDCLLKCSSKKTSKLHVTGLCVGSSPVTCEFPTQVASNAENVSIWWGHYGSGMCVEESEFLTFEFINDGCCNQQKNVL